MTRGFYDILIPEMEYGYTEGEQDAYLDLAQWELEDELHADVRLRYSSDGAEGYTYIAADGRTGQGPLTKKMKAALERVLESYSWAESDPHGI